MINEKLYLAADSGGSKTEWRLLKSDGSVIASIKTDGLGAVKEGILPVADTVKKAYEYIKQYGNPSFLYLSLGGPNTAEVGKALNLYWQNCIITVERESLGNAILAAAEMGGAVAIRADGPRDISAIKRLVHVPIIGIYKTEPSPDIPYITPDFEHFIAVLAEKAV